MLYRKLISVAFPAFLSFCILLSACKTEKTEAKQKRTKDGPTVDMGMGIPGIGLKRNDTLGITLAPSARYFFIDLSLKVSDQNIKLINRANRLDIPVRARVFKNNENEIAEIYPATEKDIERYRKSKIPTK
jgi:hypothetical protein